MYVSHCQLREGTDTPDLCHLSVQECIYPKKPVRGREKKSWLAQKGTGRSQEVLSVEGPTKSEYLSKEPRY